MITTIAHGTILDTSTMSMVGDGDVVIEDGVIVQVGGSYSGKADVTIDARGSFVLPGLIDAHVHFRLATMDLASLMQWSEVEYGIVMSRLAADTVQRGFTTVRDLGGDVTGLMRAIDRGDCAGPRIIRAGHMISQTGGHGDARGGHLEPPSCACAMATSPFGIVADGADAVRKASRHILRDGSDFIKIHVSGGVASPRDPLDSVQFTREEIEAAVVEAQHRHTYVAAHAYSSESVTMAVLAGVSSIEHGNHIDAATAKLIAERDAIMVPTLATYVAMDERGERLGLPKQNIAKNKVVLEAGLTSLETARAAGVTMGFGTDLLGESQYMQNRELAIRSEAVPAHELLHSMWNVNARLCRLEGTIGVLAPGAVGDVVVSRVNPLDDIVAFSRHETALSHVVQAGHVVRQ